MDFLARLSWVDLAIVIVLGLGVFAGFTQGMVRYILNGIAVIVAFILAAQLKGPLVDLLGFWNAFTPEGRELLVFVLLFIVLVVGGFLLIRGVYHRTTMPVARQVDEIGGAIFGFAFAALLITLHLLVFDTLFLRGGETEGVVGSYYQALNDSLIVGFLRDTVVPAVGAVARPFVPREVADVLGP